MYNKENILKELKLNEELHLIIKDEVGSTNTELQLLAKKGAAEFTVMLTESQTGGKGRMGRTFHSPKGSGIYMSILLKPGFAPRECNLLTPMTAVAAAEAIEKVTGVKTDIKWPNDIYKNGKKVGGILTKAAFSSPGKTDYVIVGIGINLTEPEGGFHKEIEDVAGALKSEASLFERDRLTGVFLSFFVSYYKALPQVIFKDEYEKRLLYVGEKIRVIEKGNFYFAEAVGVDKSFCLEVITEKGEKKTLYTEEVSIRTNKNS